MTSGFCVTNKLNLFFIVIRCREYASAGENRAVI